MSDTAALVTSRVRRYCAERYWDDRGLHHIEPGDDYVRLVAFPGDIHDGPGPWVMTLCVPCYRANALREIPPRRKRRRRR